ncbi:MAG: DUF3419 family protein [Nanoarchaeota archaeon]
MAEKSMSSCAPIYVYATEMVGIYYKNLNISGKKILTVCGSGDQVLNAYFYGAKEVIGFDLNERSKFILDLKKAGIKKFNYDEFLKFFGKFANEGFDYKLYLKLMPDLTVTSRKFFDSLYKQFHLNGKNLVKSKYFRQRNDFSQDTQLINSYLRNDVNYRKIKNILIDKKIQFIQGNILEIYKKLNCNKFDIINLSNVPNYLVGSFIQNKESEPLMLFYNNVLLKLKNMLFDKGKIFYYSYSPKNYPNKVAKEIPLASKNSTIKMFKSKKDFKIYQINFKGCWIKHSLDKIVIFEKFK